MSEIVKREQTGRLVEQPEQVERPEISLSVLKKRWKKFKTIKRGYYSFLILLSVYFLSFFFALLINNRPLILNYEGDFYFPAAKGYYPGKMFGENVPGEANYRELNLKWEQSGENNWMIMPIYPYSPFEDINVEGNKIYQPPSGRHWLGTDDIGRDVFARLLYGFRISLSFGIGLTLISYLIGVSLGASMGYFGGRFDLFSQRFIEIWSTLPLLFIVIIISSIIRPSFFILILILTITSWTGMTYFMRAEFYREKTKDYVAAAISIGQSNFKIIFKHILPNSLVPIITYFPFAVIGGISMLVGLDFLGFGLPPPTPSWGQMVSVGLKSITKWWMVLSPLGALFLTLLTIVFIGEAVREAFDPKVFSRLR